MPLQVAQSLIPGTTNTPLDARSVVSTLADILTIELPYVGMRVYCIATGKEYRILTLKAKTIGPLSVENAAVDTYEEIASGATTGAATLIPITPLTGNSVTVSPGNAYTWTVDGSYTLNITGGEEGKTGDALLDITINNGSVTPGTGLTLASAIPPYSDIKCAIRWTGTTATLHILGGGGAASGGTSISAAPVSAIIPTPPSQGDAFHLILQHYASNAWTTVIDSETDFARIRYFTGTDFETMTASGIPGTFSGYAAFITANDRLVQNDLCRLKWTIAGDTSHTQDSDWIGFVWPASPTSPL